MARGFTLADVPSRVSWRAVKVMLLHPWEDAEHLAAHAVDALRILAWQKTENGRTGVGRPDPMPRPGDVLAAMDAAEKAKQIIEAAKARGW